MSHKIELLRTIRNNEGNYGLFALDGRPICLSYELPWRDNQNKISCIEAGSYICRPYKSPAHGDVFLLEGVPGRDMIEIHIANNEDDLLGCIAPGMKYGLVRSNNGEIPKMGVLASTEAMYGLKKAVSELDNPKRFLLIIKDLFKGA